MVTVIDAIIWIALIVIALVVYVRIETKKGEAVGIAAIKRDIDGTKSAMKLMDQTYGTYIDSLYEKHNEKKKN